MSTPHCFRCELPKQICACEEQRQIDRAWKLQELRLPPAIYSKDIADD